MATSMRRGVTRRPPVDGVSTESSGRPHFSPPAKAAPAARDGILRRKWAQSFGLVHVLAVPAGRICRGRRVGGRLIRPAEKPGRGAGGTSAGSKAGDGTRTSDATRLLTEGVPFYQIIRAASRLRCDLIVMATQGGPGSCMRCMGSVTGECARGRPCPVLTVRPPRFQSGV